MIEREFALFVGTFTTLLAIINPLEVLPVYLKLLARADAPTRRAVALKSCEKMSASGEWRTGS